MTSDDARLDALFEAHVAFELGSWRRSAHDSAPKALLDEIWRWAGQTTLRDVLAPATLITWLTQLTADTALPDDLEARIGRIVDDLVRLNLHRETAVAAVVDRAAFNEGVAAIIALERLRYKLIHHLSNSPLAATVAGDVLHQGIKDFALSESGGLAALPGVGSLLRGSSELFGRRMPRLEAELDKRIRTYIAGNTARTLARSEARLVETFNATTIEAIAETVWAEIRDQSLSAADVLAANELQTIVDAGIQLWRGVRTTDYWHELIEAGIGAYYARFGDEPLAATLAGLGLTRAAIGTQADTLAPALVAGLDATGLLESLIRARLAAFYQSPECCAAMDTDA